MFRKQQCLKCGDMYRVQWLHACDSRKLKLAALEREIAAEKKFRSEMRSIESKVTPRHLWDSTPQRKPIQTRSRAWDRYETVETVPVSSIGRQVDEIVVASISHQPSWSNQYDDVTPSYTPSHSCGSSDYGSSSYGSGSSDYGSSSSSDCGSSYSGGGD